MRKNTRTTDNAPRNLTGLATAIAIRPSGKDWQRRIVRELLKIFLASRKQKALPMVPSTCPQSRDLFGRSTAQSPYNAAAARFDPDLPSCQDLKLAFSIARRKGYYSPRL